MGTPDRWRTLGLAEGFAVMGDGAIRPAPREWWAEGLGVLLNKLAGHYGPEGVLLLDRSAAVALGLPTERVPRGGIDHVALDDATRAGWQHGGKLSDWTHFYGTDRPSIHVAVEPMLDLTPDREGWTPEAPFWRAEFHDTTRTLDIWHRLSGVPWRGSAGMAGLAVLKRYAPQQVNDPDPRKRRAAPTWHPSVVGPDDAYETRYELSHFRNTPADPCWVHGYDDNRAYIAAAQACEVCPWMLKHTGRIAFSPRLAGWWQVELAPWNDPRMPDPAGYGEDEQPGRARVRWITTKRLELLEQLTAEGVYGGARIIDSWTGPARDTVLKPWAERMRDMYVYRDPAGRLVELDIRDQITVQLATKEVGRRTLGMLNNAGNWVYRPDWWYGVVGLQSVNKWRRSWKVGKRDGRWPFAFDVDNVYYASAERDPAKAAPPALLECPRKCGCNQLDATGEKLGHVKPGKSYRYPPRRKP